MSRPSHVHCIRRYHVSEHGKAYCGRDINMEFHFQSMDHAAASWPQSGLETCGRCVDAAVKALKEARYKRERQG